jgi:hypothetical protein
MPQHIFVEIVGQELLTVPIYSDLDDSYLSFKGSKGTSLSPHFHHVEFSACTSNVS